MPVDADAHAGSVATHFVERERFFKDCSVIQIEAARVTTMDDKCRRNARSDTISTRVSNLDSRLLRFQSERLHMHTRRTA